MPYFVFNFFVVGICLLCSLSCAVGVVLGQRSPTWLQVLCRLPWKADYELRWVRLGAKAGGWGRAAACVSPPRHSPPPQALFLGVSLLCEWKVLCTAFDVLAQGFQAEKALVALWSPENSTGLWDQ